MGLTGECQHSPREVGGSSYLQSELPNLLPLNVIVVVHVLLIALGNEVPKQWCHICSQVITAVRVSLAGAGEIQNKTEPFLVSLPSLV